MQHKTRPLSNFATAPSASQTDLNGWCAWPTIWKSQSVAQSDVTRTVAGHLLLVLSSSGTTCGHNSGLSQSASGGKRRPSCRLCVTALSSLASVAADRDSGRSVVGMDNVVVFGTLFSWSRSLATLLSGCSAYHEDRACRHPAELATCWSESRIGF